MGLSLDDCVVWNPHQADGGLTPEQLRDARMILWQGHCSVHGRFTAECVDDVRAQVPDVTRPGAPRVPARGRAQGRPGRLDRVHHQDRRGRARRLRLGDRHRAQPRASGWRPQHPDKRIMFLDKTVCYCSTMNRIDLPHFVWAMENLVAGTAGQRDRGRPRDRALGQGRPPADARPARQEPPRLIPGRRAVRRAVRARGSPRQRHPAGEVAAPAGGRARGWCGPASPAATRARGRLRRAHAGRTGRTALP